MRNVCGAVASVAIAAGATYAAIYFDNPSILWWSILILFV